MLILLNFEAAHHDNSNDPALTPTLSAKWFDLRNIFIARLLVLTHNELNLRLGAIHKRAEWFASGLRIVSLAGT